MPSISVPQAAPQAANAASNRITREASSGAVAQSTGGSALHAASRRRQRRLRKPGATASAARRWSAAAPARPAIRRRSTSLIARPAFPRPRCGPACMLRRSIDVERPPSRLPRAPSLKVPASSPRSVRAQSSSVVHVCCCCARSRELQRWSGLAFPGSEVESQRRRLNTTRGLRRQYNASMRAEVAAAAFGSGTSARAQRAARSVHSRALALTPCPLAPLQSLRARAQPCGAHHDRDALT